jgi:nucleotide-binding universal stress UspA family protein
MARIVVGVDGSGSSKEALRWAAAEAQRSGAVLDVVMAWDNPYREMWLPSDPPGADRLALVKRTVRGLVDEVLGPQPPVTVEAMAAEGPPAQILVRAAGGADLLVVGSRGHGGFAGVMLGSVSLHCVSHAPCPVVVVRDATSEGS